VSVAAPRTCEECKLRPSWETDHMEELDEQIQRPVVDALRDSGAVCAFLHGSTARGTARAGSDLLVGIDRG
jgi:predicted nucleotidyltransferase